MPQIITDTPAKVQTLEGHHDRISLLNTGDGTDTRISPSSWEDT